MKTPLKIAIGPVLFAAAMAHGAAPDCTWNKPGANPYRGPAMQSVTSALGRYPDIPTSAALAIISKVRLLQPDTTATITRDGVQSKDGQVSNLRDMHYGNNKLCNGPVQRSKWSDTQAETAMVYCAQGHCVAIPIICGNVSRVDYTPAAQSKPEPQVRGSTENQSRLDPNYPPGSRGPYNVPAPSTAALVALGIVVMTVMKRSK